MTKYYKNNKYKGDLAEQFVRNKIKNKNNRVFIYEKGQDLHGKEIEEVNRLRDVEPHDNPIYLYLEAQARLEGFKAGQLAEREKFYYWLFDLKKGQKKWSTYQLIKIQKKLEELTQKINSSDGDER